MSRILHSLEYFLTMEDANKSTQVGRIRWNSRNSL